MWSDPGMEPVWCLLLIQQGLPARSAMSFTMLNLKLLQMTAKEFVIFSGFVFFSAYIKEDEFYSSNCARNAFGDLCFYSCLIPLSAAKSSGPSFRACPLSAPTANNGSFFLD